MLDSNKGELSATLENFQATLDLLWEGVRVLSNALEAMDSTPSYRFDQKADEELKLEVARLEKSPSSAIVEELPTLVREIAEAAIDSLKERDATSSSEAPDIAFTTYLKYNCSSSSTPNGRKN